MHPDQKFITYLKDNNAEGISEIYKLYSGNVKRMIVKNSGDEDDAADIFQESLIDIYNLAHKPNFSLTCPFEAFLITVCKRKWLNVLKKRKQSPVTKSVDDVYTTKHEAQAIDTYIDQIEEEDTVMLILETMGESCRTIIKACMSGIHQEKVADSLGLSYAYLRKKKSECMNILGQLVKEHPLFKNK